MPEETETTLTTASQEAKEESSSSTAKVAEQPPDASQTSNAKLTLENVARAIVKKADDADKEKAAESQTAKDDDAKVVEEVDKKEESTAKETKEEETKDDEKDKLPPFHEHPRWKEMVKERDEHKAAVEAAKPLVERINSINDYCKRYGINDNQLNEAIEIAALLINDPITAHKRLTPIMQALGGYTGDSLPKDLAKEVEDGTLSKERAQELVQLRSQGLVQQRSVAVQQEATNRVTQTAIQSALNAWDMSRRKTDPDFSPAANGTDGKYEIFRDRLMSLVTTRAVRTPEEAVRLAEEAYDSTTNFMKRFSPQRKATSKVLSNNTSTTTKAAEKPKTLLDVARQVVEANRQR